MKSPTFAKQTSQGDTSMSACFLKLSAQTVIFSIIEALLIAEMESQPLTGRLAICTNVRCFLCVLDHAYHRHCCRERVARVPAALEQLGHIVGPFCIGVWHVCDGLSFHPACRYMCTCLGRAFQTSERLTTGSVGTRLNASPNQGDDQLFGSKFTLTVR
jgi:hypothetical protein